MTPPELSKLIKACQKEYWVLLSMKQYYKADQMKHKIKLLKAKWKSIK